MEEFVNKLVNGPSLSNWLEYFSGMTWNRIGILSKIKSRVSETTITENLVFEFHLISGSGIFPIEIYMAKDEKANGNDIEIFIETYAGYILMPCQAKIIKGNYKYSSIPHKVKGREQIDLLLEYAKRKKGIAAYLLYNYSDHFFRNDKLQNEISFPVESFGCSIANASFLKETYYDKRTRNNKPTWKIPSFYDLHPVCAMPLHYLGYLDSSKWFPFDQSLNKDKSIKFYTGEEIENDSNWKELIQRGAIGRIKLENSEITSEIQQTPSSLPVFNPKFRIVFSIKRKERGLYLVY